MKKPFDNKERTRHYGLRVGDIVYQKFGRGIFSGEVIELNPMDNNAVFVRNDEGVVSKCVAEWCTIIKKVEEIGQNK